MEKNTVLDYNELLFDCIATNDVVNAVEKAFSELNKGSFGEWTVENMSLSPQVLCGIFHELIVNEISKLPGWRPGLQKKEFDIVHDSGIQLQVKTKSDSEGIAGNRYSSKTEYSDPSGYYLCVNFLPKDSICKIRIGWVEADWWKPQNGNGNASVLPKDKLNELVFLYGDYLKSLNLIAVESFGEKTIEKLKTENITTLSDFLNQDKYIKAKKLLSEKQMIHINDYLLHIA
jgi:hypothetical protein